MKNNRQLYSSSATLQNEIKMKRMRYLTVINLDLSDLSDKTFIQGETLYTLFSLILALHSRSVMFSHKSNNHDAIGLPIIYFFGDHLQKNIV